MNFIERASQRNSANSRQQNSDASSQPGAQTRFPNNAFPTFGNLNQNLHISAPINPQLQPPLPRKPINPNFRFDNDPRIVPDIGRRPVDISSLTVKSFQSGKSNSLDKYTIKPAPKDQYKLYIQKTENVFYEDRYEAKVARYLRLLVWVLSAIMVGLVLLYLAVNSVTPYEGLPPKNGKVFNKVIYCEFGYQRVGNECVLQDIYNIEAQQFALNVITDLRIQFGDNDCSHITSLPTRNVEQQIESNEKLETEKSNLLIQQVKEFLNSKVNKDVYKYDYDGRKVWPTEKMYSYSCRLKLLVESGIILKTLGLLVALSVAVVLLYRWYQRRETAQRIYEFLKARVQKETTIKIDNQREAMERIGHVDEQMWNRIDKLRTSEKLIGFFQDDNLYWKKL